MSITSCRFITIVLRSFVHSHCQSSSLTPTLSPSSTPTVMVVVVSVQGKVIRLRKIPKGIVGGSTGSSALSESLWRSRGSAA